MGAAEKGHSRRANGGQWRKAMHARPRSLGLSPLARSHKESWKDLVQG